MEVKHTAGPWRIHRGGNVPFRKAAFNVGDVAWIGPQRKIDSANARLIAAAPDLLLALEECRRILSHSFPEDDREIMKGLRLANSAINKAEGRE